MSKVRDEVDELLSRLTETEKQELLDSLMRRWIEERAELLGIYGIIPRKERADANG